MTEFFAQRTEQTVSEQMADIPNAETIQAMEDVRTRKILYFYPTEQENV